MNYQISKGSKSFGTNTVFEDIQFEIKGNEKIAVVGRNGCGKSTLLKVIMQEEELDSGVIHKNKDLSIGYLTQTTFEDDMITVEEEFMKLFAPVFELKERLEEVSLKMAEDYNDSLLEKYSVLQEQFEAMNGYNYKQELMTVFTKFGFKEEDMKRPINTFSGGQRTRLAFVRLLMSKPDVLLLDEPTNHLDLNTIEWLEGYLKYYNKAIVLVSHDRMFMDHICEVIYEIEYGTMKKYTGNYSSFVEQKKQDQQRQAQAYARQQKDIERLEGLIEKFRYKKNKAAFAQSKIKYLERMERVEAPTKSDTKAFSAHFTPRLKGGKTVLTVQDLIIGYDHPLCSINLEIMNGEKVAIIGGNGQGKSTFVKTIMGLVKPLSGSYLLGHQIEPGYFDQQIAQINSTKTVLEELWDEYPDLDRTQIRSVLGRFLFSSDDVFKTVDVLSGGEKVRLSLAKLMMKQSNLLLLDEPTNHLDIVGKEALEDALNGYSGTLLLVSHDRYFIRKIATSILVIEEGKAVYYPYGYDEYMENSSQKQSLPKKEDKKNEIVETKPKKVLSPDGLRREIAKVEKMIDEKENELEMNRQLRFDPEYYHDYQKMQILDEKIDEIHNEIEHLMERWEELNAEAEK